MTILVNTEPKEIDFFVMEEADAWSNPELRVPRYSQSLERGLAILMCFTPEEPIRGIADVANELGIKRSTTHRYMSTLVALGYLEQGAGHKYRLSLRVTGLGMSALAATSLREHAHPYMEALAHDSSYTVSLSVLDGLEIVYIDRVHGFRHGQVRAPLDLAADSRLPFHCTAMGKVLVGNLSEQTQRDILSEMKFTRVGPKTIHSKGAMRLELESVSEEGFAVNDEELALELYAIAVPVRTESEVVAAMSLSAHSSLIPLPAMVNHLKPHLTATADRVSAAWLPPRR